MDDRYLGPVEHRNGGRLTGLPTQVVAFWNRRSHEVRLPGLVSYQSSESRPYSVLFRLGILFDHFMLSERHQESVSRGLVSLDLLGRFHNTQRASSGHALEEQDSPVHGLDRRLFSGCFSDKWASRLTFRTP